MQKKGKRVRIIVVTAVLLLLFGVPAYAGIQTLIRELAIANIRKAEDFKETIGLDETLSKKEAEEDIEAVFKTISSKHQMKNRDPDAFEKVEATYKNVLGRLYDGISVQELWVLSSELEHQLMDAHSCVRINIKDDEKRHLIKEKFYVDDDGSIWYEDGIKKYKVMSLNGVTAEEIYNNALERLSYENVYWLSTVLEQQLSSAENMRLLDIPYHEEGLMVSYDTEEGEKETLLTYYKEDKTGVEETKEYETSFDESMSMAVFVMNEMNYTEDFLNDTVHFFGEVKRRDVHNVVIDLRNNLGGNSMCAEPFVDFLAEEFQGKAYVLTSHKTFSSGLLFTQYLVCGKLAVSVGEETGGSPNSYGEVRFYSMPNSRLLYRVTQKYFEGPEEMEGLNTICPDVRIDAEDAMDKVKELIGEEKES